MRVMCSLLRVLAIICHMIDTLEFTKHGALEPFRYLPGIQAICNLVLMVQDCTICVSWEVFHYLHGILVTFRFSISTLLNMTYRH